MKRKTSLDSYSKIKPTLKSRQAQVLKILKNQDLSNRQISEKLKLPINRITPRTNELVKRGLVYCCGKSFDKVTKKTVMVWSAI